MSGPIRLNMIIIALAGAYVVLVSNKSLISTACWTSVKHCAGRMTGSALINQVIQVEKTDIVGHRSTIAVFSTCITWLNHGRGSHNRNIMQISTFCTSRHTSEELKWFLWCWSYFYDFFGLYDGDWFEFHRRLSIIYVSIVRYHIHIILFRNDLYSK